MKDDLSPAALPKLEPASAPWARALADKRLLVTGAAGFIGGALFRRLRAYGCDVTATVLYPHEADAIRDHGGKAEVLDLASDAPFAAPLLGIDIVFQLAAMFQETEHGEGMYRVVNETAALKLCQAAAAAGVGRFVHCSTVGVHGDVKRVPCMEATRSIRWICTSAPSWRASWRS
jgi:dihydroflavonol-4-reductase